jgi:hypothetical protein
MGNLSDLFGGEYDSSQYQGDNDFAPLPPGEYTVTIDKAEIKQTKAGDGHYVNVQLSVVGDKYANRKMFDRMNIDNPSQKAVEIGLRQFSSLCRAAAGGQDVKVTDTDELLGQTVVVKVAVKDDQNVVKAYKVAGTQQPMPPSQPSQKPKQPPRAKLNEQQGNAYQNRTPPWKR